MVGVPEDKKMEIGLGTYEREQLLHQYNKTFSEFCKMTAWFNDPDTAPEEKTRFIPILKNMIETINIQTKLLECAGIPNEVIADNLSLPF